MRGMMLRIFYYIHRKEQTIMDIKDMAELIMAHDGVRELEKAVVLLNRGATAAAYDEGALGKLSHIYNVILKNTRLYDADMNVEDAVDEQGRSILEILDLNIPAVKRAEMLL